MDNAQPALPIAPTTTLPLPRYRTIPERRELMKRRHPSLTEADLDRYVGKVSR